MIFHISSFKMCAYRINPRVFKFHIVLYQLCIWNEWIKFSLVATKIWLVWLWYNYVVKKWCIWMKWKSCAILRSCSEVSLHTVTPFLIVCIKKYMSNEFVIPEHLLFMNNFRLEYSSVVTIQDLLAGNM